MRRSFLAALVVGSSVFSVFLACTDAEVDSPEQASTDGGSRDGQRELTDTGTSFETDAAKPPPPGPDCPPIAPPLPPDLSGPRACGAIDFGRTAAPFVPVDASAPAFDTGGVLAPGIYDVVTAERASGSPGSWRETIVVGSNGRFTRSRQIDTGSGPGPVSYRSGTFSTDGGHVTLAEDCYVVNDAGADAGISTLPYVADTDACGNTAFSYSVTGFRFTFVPRR